jgi:hypothetical protein
MIRNKHRFMCCLLRVVFRHLPVVGGDLEKEIAYRLMGGYCRFHRIFNCSNDGPVTQSISPAFTAAKEMGEGVDLTMTGGLFGATQGLPVMGCACMAAPSKPPVRGIQCWI